jgi:hypothetical protein
LLDVMVGSESGFEGSDARLDGSLSFLFCGRRADALEIVSGLCTKGRSP